MLPHAAPAQILSLDRRDATRWACAPCSARCVNGACRIVLGAILAAAAPWLVGQTAPAAPQSAAPPAAPTEAARPALNRVSEAVAGLNVSRWKAPGEVRSVTQRDIDSIQRDIASTLPPLLDRAAAQTASVAAYFAVYRNIDALYDVLLRVSETATLAGSQSDADTLQRAQTGLEGARRALGDAILAAANNQERDLTDLRAVAAQAAAAEAAKPVPPTKTVVVDGPATPSKPTASAKKKKKAASAATAATPANGTGSAPPR